MRSILLPALFAVAACSANGGNAESADGIGGDDIALSGKSGTRSFNVSGFDAIALLGPDNVTVKVGAAESVTASGDQALLDRLEVDVKDGRLRIGRQRKNGFLNGSNGKGAVDFTVTLPALRAASLAGSGNMKIDSAKAAEFSAEIAGSGTLDIGALEAETAKMSIAGSGDVKIAKGGASAADFNIAGSGNVDASGFTTRTSRISIAGSGDAKTNVTDQAKVSIMGSGDVVITGGAQCTVSKIGSGEVRCGATDTKAARVQE